MGTYYYDSEEYNAAFNTLKELKDVHTAKYLGLMYYYGRGTEPNHELARKYLEWCYETTWCVGPEVIWALGDLYYHYGMIQEQLDLYLTELGNPYVDYDNPFIKRMLKHCLTLKKHTMIKDNMFMTIEVNPEDLECEFSLDIAPYCHITVNWDDKTCDIYGNLGKSGTVTCRHKYSSSGTFTITIESLWDKVIEGFDFSRHKRQLHTIYYDHALTELELAFAKLKGLSENVNINPYEGKDGFLAVNDSYVSDDTIRHTEEFFILEESWTTCLATKVRDKRRREPWMSFSTTPPEYYVGNCLVNMIHNRHEMDKYVKLQKQKIQ